MSQERSDQGVAEVWLARKLSSRNLPVADAEAVRLGRTVEGPVATTAPIRSTVSNFDSIKSLLPSPDPELAQRRIQREENERLLAREKAARDLPRGELLKRLRIFIYDV